MLLSSVIALPRAPTTQTSFIGSQLSVFFVDPQFPIITALRVRRAFENPRHPSAQLGDNVALGAGVHGKLVILDSQGIHRLTVLENLTVVLLQCPSIFFFGITGGLQAGGGLALQLAVTSSPLLEAHAAVTARGAVQSASATVWNEDRRRCVGWA